MPTGGQLGKWMCSTELKWVSQGYRSGTRAPLIVNTAPTPATTSVQHSLTAVLKMAIVFSATCYQRSLTFTIVQPLYQSHQIWPLPWLHDGNICITEMDPSIKSFTHHWEHTDLAWKHFSLVQEQRPGWLVRLAGCRRLLWCSTSQMRCWTVALRKQERIGLWLVTEMAVGGPKFSVWV